MIGVGIVGGGFGLRAHVPAFRSDKRCRVVAIGLSDRVRAEQAAKKLGIARGYGSWRDLVDDPAVNVVSLAVPPALQEEIVRYAIRRKKPVFLEKPLAVNYSRAKKLESLLRRSHLPNGIDLEYPATAAWREARRLLHSKKMGSVRHVMLSWQIDMADNRLKKTTWKTNAAQGGGALNLFGSHAFHYLEWLLGPIEAVNARLLKPPGLPGEQETLCAMRVKFKKGFYGNLTIASHCVHGSGHRVEIYGDKGSLLIRVATGQPIDEAELYFGAITDKMIKKVDLKVPALRKGAARSGAVAELVGRFVDAVIQHRTSHPNAGDGLRAQQIIDAARRSHDAGGQVMWL
jgi:predicted dehydrogenase